MELKEKVLLLISDVEKTHKYSTSRIYGVYNEVFETTEKPQSCASCLIRKISQLKIWLREQDILLEKLNNNEEQSKAKLKTKKTKQKKQP